MKRNKVIIVVTVLTVIFIILVLSLINRNPRRVFSKIFGFALPESATFVEYHYRSSNESLGAKIHIDENTVEVLKQKSFAFIWEELYSDNPSHQYNGNNYSWWDMDEDSVILHFVNMVDGKKNIFGGGAKTSIIWGFITKDANGEYYLYIDKV